MGITKYQSLSGVIKTGITRRNRSIKIAVIVDVVVVFIPGGEISSCGHDSTVVHKP